MTSLEVRVDEDTHIASYEPPQLAEVEITESTIILGFDPKHSDRTSLTYDLDNLKQLSLTLD